MPRAIVAPRRKRTPERYDCANDCLEGRCVDWCGFDRLRDALLEILRPAEQHLALVGEVAKEGSLRQARARGDLPDRRTVVTPLVK
jgi:hypothetical protein